MVEAGQRGPVLQREPDVILNTTFRSHLEKEKDNHRQSTCTVLIRSIRNKGNGEWVSVVSK